MVVDGPTVGLLALIGHPAFQSMKVRNRCASAN